VTDLRAKPHGQRLTGDAHNLERFVQAQSINYDDALAELRSGKKRTHWMWYIFPQIEGLGTRATAREFAIKSESEARAYLDHPILGPRLLDCARTVAAIDGR